MRKFIYSGIMLLFFVSLVIADVPSVVNYQGLLKDNVGDPIADGSYSIVFTIYDDSTSGTTLWTETQSVSTVDGLFAVLLGSSTAIDNSVFDSPQRFLGVQVGLDSELSPRTRIASVPYAMHAGTVASTSAVSDWTVGGDLEDLYDGNGTLSLFPPEEYEYGYKWIDQMIHKALCTKWNVGFRFYNIEPYFINSDNPTAGMDYGGVMFYIETQATDDDTATPSSWRHHYWKIDSTNTIVTLGSNGLVNTNVYVRKR